MKFTTTAAILASFIALPALAGGHATGDAAAGEKAFNQCKACHEIVDADGNTIVKGGKTRPEPLGPAGPHRWRSRGLRQVQEGHRRRW